MTKIRRIKSRMLSAIIGVAVASVLAGFPKASPAGKPRYFIEYLEGDTEPLTVSGWQNTRKSTDAGTKETRAIDLSYSGSGWSMSLCAGAGIADISGTLSLQKADNGWLRIYPAAPEGEFSLRLSAGATWPDGCAAIHFDGLAGSAHAFELNESLLIPETGFQWRQKKDLPPAGEKSWISVSLPRAEAVETRLVVPDSLLAKVLARRANETETMPMAAQANTIPKKLRDNTGSFGVDDNPSPFPFHPPGHPKEALFDIDLSLLYEPPSGDEQEQDEGWGEIRFFSADGEGRFVILPIELIRQWLDDPQADSAEFWKSILTGCREQGCDELFHTLALIHRSGQPKGDPSPEAEPVDMLSWGRGDGATHRGGFSGHSAGLNPGAGRDQGGGARSGRQADQGEGAGTPPAELLKGLPNWEEKLLDHQFTLLELAFEIRSSWTEVAALIGLPGGDIQDLKMGSGSEHMKAFRMLSRFLGYRGFSWSLKHIHNHLSANGKIELAEKCRDVAGRTPPAVPPWFSLDHIFPRNSRVIQNMREPLLMGLYLGLSDRDIHDLEYANRYHSEQLMALDMIDKLKSRLGSTFPIPSALPRLVLAAQRTSQLNLLESLTGGIGSQAFLLVDRIRSGTFFQSSIPDSGTPAPATAKASASQPTGHLARPSPAVQRPESVSETQWQALAGMPVPAEFRALGELADARALVVHFNTFMAAHNVITDVFKELISKMLPPPPQPAHHSASELPASAMTTSSELPGVGSCCICQEIYNEPVALNCGHSLCERCATRLIGRPTSPAYCPTCRTLITSIKPNIAPREMLEAGNKRHQTDSSQSASASRQEPQQRTQPAQHWQHLQPTDEDLVTISLMGFDMTVLLYMGMSRSEQKDLDQNFRYVQDRRREGLMIVRDKCQLNGESFYLKLFTAAKKAGKIKFLEDVCSHLNVSSKEVKSFLGSH